MLFPTASNLHLKSEPGFAHQLPQSRDGPFATFRKSRRSFPNGRSLTSAATSGEKALLLRLQPDWQFASALKSKVGLPPGLPHPEVEKVSGLLLIAGADGFASPVPALRSLQG